MVTIIQQYIHRYWGFIVLLVWGGVILGAGLVRFTGYHMDESSARALLLTWSFVQQVATPIPLASLPDLRTLLLLPVALYWPGSLIAAKVFTLLVTFGGVALFYRWSKQGTSAEVALIASALLLISPLTIKQIDAVGAGPYLLLALGLSVILERRYRAGKRLVSGWYFSQILLAAFAVSLHPAGLAYPLALAWGWHQVPIVETPRRKYLYLGLVLAPLFVLIFQSGWVAAPWLAGPVAPLAGIFSGTPAAMEHTSALAGVLLLCLFVILLILDHRFLTSDFLGRVLLIASFIGLSAADGTWGMIVLAVLLYRGIYFLILVNDKLNRPGLLGQRGIVLFCLFVVATSFMVGDKTYARVVRHHLLSPQDLLIQDVDRVSKAENKKTGKPVRIASQWPGRTMLICKCYVLPLPPPAADGPAFLKEIRGITYLAFDHRDRANRRLVRNISEVGGVAETIAVKSSGVIVKIRESLLKQESQPDNGAGKAGAASGGGKTSPDR